MKVVKKSRKPFKSGLKTNTVKEICINPKSGKKAYAFIEDDSYVNISQCDRVADLIVKTFIKDSI